MSTPERSSKNEHSVDGSSQEHSRCELDDAIARWLAEDPDQETVRELSELRASNVEAARMLFAGRIAFGTAGLRAPMGPGPLRMNQLVVRQTTAGLMRWLSDRSTGPVRVVIGFDARTNSKKFADEVARTVAANGGIAELIPEPTPTPVLARAVLDRSACAGVMITASHNPAPDNGYKLYLDDGIQLSSPADAEIAAAIDQVVSRVQQPSDASSELAMAPRSERVHELGSAVIDQHKKVAIGVLHTDARNISVLYTPVHGVGGAQALACFHAAGFPVPMVVAAQFGPDPNFSTAQYPNPEDPGALAPALAEAARLQQSGVDLDLIIANDPDADRLAVTVWQPDQGWIQLSGDHLGALLADHILRHSELGGHDLVVSSVVSSLLVPKMAAAVGVESVRTLTGFKWIARPIVDRPEARYLFGYEEALGFCIGNQVRDKDGISAALLIAEAAAEQRRNGRTLLDRLDRLFVQHGIHLTGQLVVDLGAMDQSDRALTKRKALALSPSSLAGIPVADREDLAEGRRLPPASGILLNLQDGSRVVVRPSGTEPKIKIYLEVVAAVESLDEVEEAKEVAKHKLEGLKRSVADLVAND